MGKNRDFQREKRHLAMGHERTAPFATPENPPALRVEVTGLAHKASGLSPASFRSSVLSAVCWGKPACGTDHGTYLIRLILRRGFLPSKRPAKTGQVRPEIGQGLFPYSVCESRTQAHTSGTAEEIRFCHYQSSGFLLFLDLSPKSFSLFIHHSFCIG